MRPEPGGETHIEGLGVDPTCFMIGEQRARLLVVSEQMQRQVAVTDLGAEAAERVEHAGGHHSPEVDEYG